MNRCLVALLACALLTGCTSTGPPAGELRGYGIRLRIPNGWHAFIHGPRTHGTCDGMDALVVNFRAQDAFSNGAVATSVPMKRGDVRIALFYYGPMSAHSLRWRRDYPVLRGPLRIRESELHGGFEGIPQNRAFALKTFEIGHRDVAVWVDLGPRPLQAGRLRQVNATLRTLRVAACRKPYARSATKTSTT